MKAVTPLLFFLTMHLAATFSFAEEIKIGWIGPLSGNAAVLGIDSAEVVQMVFDRANAEGGVHGKRLKLFVEDDQYLTAKTVAAYNKLVHQQGIKILYVLTYGGLFAIADKAQRDGVLLLDPLDCDARIAALPSNTLCISKRTEELGEIIAKAALSNADTPVAMIYFDGDPFMGILADSSKKTITKQNGEIVFSEGYLNETLDFKTLVKRAQSKGAKSLFLFGYDSLGTAMREARNIGIKIPFYAVNTITSPGFQEAAGEAANGTIVGTWLAPRTPAFAEFKERFNERKGRDPIFEVSAIPSYDVAELIVQSLREQKGNVHLQDIRKFFYDLKNYNALSGTISMEQDGAASGFKNGVYSFENGTLKELSLSSPM